MNAAPRPLGRSRRLPAALAVAALALSGSVGLAQTPTAGVASHPAHIHAGTCADLGDIVVPLDDIAGPDAAAGRRGPETAIPIKTSETVVDLPLEEILAGDHAINVHLSADEIGTYIACGDIGGVVHEDEDGQSELEIGLGELNDSGYAGVAWLGTDGDQTEVAVVLIEAMATD